ncbi:MAG TPA: aminotransferase class V-fold PLP-dependent enzyme, partial [Fimbriimonadaceae bacterium]|nr:aminotransferase class V-fold PLP-dependent enzyme [Fimbriimonadaceae bacterium]
MDGTERYFDNAATTPLDPSVREAMAPFLAEAFGNAHSIHGWGLRAHDAVEHAREQVARVIGAEDPSQITFTSGATESNNWVLKAASEIAISPFEHSSMREPAITRGATLLGVREERPSLPRLVSVMSVNNEVGTIWHAPDYAQPGDLIHSDITQAVGKVPVSVEGLDFASFSGHKFYGPKGVGALYAKDQPPEPLIRGGEQEHGARGGTLNGPAIVGLGVAAEIAIEEQPENYRRATELRAILLDGLNGLLDWQVNGGDRVSPFILSLSFHGLEG